MILIGNAKKNAFEVLLSGARKLSLPEPHAVDGGIVNNKRVLYNRVPKMLQKAGLGFTPTNVDQGKTLIQIITNCIWTIDPHIDTLRERSFYVPFLFDYISWDTTILRTRNTRTLPWKILLFSILLHALIDVLNSYI